MLTQLALKNFTVFKTAEFGFSTGLNVLIGENGTGKSHILKLCYALQRAISSLAGKIPPKDVTERMFAQTLGEVFLPDSLGRLASRVQGYLSASIKAEFANGGRLGINFSTRNTERVDVDLTLPAVPASTVLFIPPKEILSVFPGFQAALEKRELLFDATYLHLAKALGSATLKGKRTRPIAALLKQIEKIINSNVIKSDDKFYFHSSQTSGNIEAHLVAEGHRKLGMLMHLLQNGELLENSSLFWDEPEANLNPRLLIKLAAILASLSSVMQVTIATHSLVLLRELEILQQEKKLRNVRYFGLHFTGDDSVNVLSGDSSNDIGDIAALDASLEQSERYLQIADGEE